MISLLVAVYLLKYTIYANQPLSLLFLQSIPTPPGTSCESNAMIMCMDSGASYGSVIFDVLPDIVIPFQLSCLCYKNNTLRRRHKIQQQQQPTVTWGETALPFERCHSGNFIKWKLKWCWSHRSELERVRFTSLDTGYDYTNLPLIDLSGAFATLAQDFLRFWWF